MVGNKEYQTSIFFIVCNCVNLTCVINSHNISPLQFFIKATR